MTDIDTIFNMISSFQSEKIQKKGIEEGKKVKNFSVFFQPVEGIFYWENCATIIASKNNDELISRYLYKMLLWLRDMTWPGAETIWNRLKEFPMESIIHELDSCIIDSKKLDDEVWNHYLLCLRDEITQITHTNHT